jgi:hypothetical protein
MDPSASLLLLWFVRRYPTASAVNGNETKDSRLEPGRPTGGPVLRIMTRAPLWIRIRQWHCFCARTSSLDSRLLERIRPWTFAGLAFWCDREEACVELDA